MKKLESSFTNMVIVLTVITVIAAACLGAMNNVTAEPIAASKKAKQEAKRTKFTTNLAIVLVIALFVIFVQTFFLLV